MYSTPDIVTPWWPIVLLYLTWFICDYKSPKRETFRNECRICTLTSQFWSPLRREWAMLHGLIDCSKESLHYVLNSESFINNVAVLIVGGAEEALDAHPGYHILTLGNRKGFIKIAIETGAQLVPTYCFGENELFRQMVSNPDGSYLRFFQRKLKKITKLPSFYGRGFFSNFGFLPYRQIFHENTWVTTQVLMILIFSKPLNTVIGTPIPVTKKRNPTQEEIDSLHGLYISALTELFETYKTEFEYRKMCRSLFDN
ncbi:2-acylglycerol O-acyltransferase 2-A [Dirofilaria immitis]|nr:2-acylglycerol O-acyltransferase 2-A [Dirofilaria immitis]